MPSGFAETSKSSLIYLNSIKLSFFQVPDIIPDPATLIDNLRIMLQEHQNDNPKVFTLNIYLY